MSTDKIEVVGPETPVAKDQITKDDARVLYLLMLMQAQRYKAVFYEDDIKIVTDKFQETRELRRNPKALQAELTLHRKRDKFVSDVLIKELRRRMEHIPTNQLTIIHHWSQCLDEIIDNSFMALTPAKLVLVIKMFNAGVLDSLLEEIAQGLRDKQNEKEEKNPQT